MNPHTTTILGAVFGLLLALAIYALLVVLSCTSSSTPRQGVSIDPCEACWDACGEADAHFAAIYCSQECNTLCAMLRQDGGT